MEPEININQTRGISTAPIVEWLDPYIHPPAPGKILLLSWDNIQSSGAWGPNGHLLFAAWAPLPSRQDWLKSRMWDKYIGKFKPTAVR
jgi:hypothetical protein